MSTLMLSSSQGLGSEGLVAPLLVIAPDDEVVIAGGALPLSGLDAIAPATVDGDDTAPASGDDDDEPGGSDEPGDDSDASVDLVPVAWTMPSLPIDDLVPYGGGLLPYGGGLLPYGGGLFVQGGDLDPYGAPFGGPGDPGGLAPIGAPVAGGGPIAGAPVGGGLIGGYGGAPVIGGPFVPPVIGGPLVPPVLVAPLVPPVLVAPFVPPVIVGPFLPPVIVGPPLGFTPIIINPVIFAPIIGPIFINNPVNIIQVVNIVNNFNNGAAHGDPHLVTLDGLAYDFHAPGIFTLVEATAGDPLVVQMRNESFGPNGALSVATAAAVQVGESRVVIDCKAASPLSVDGRPVELGSGGASLEIGGAQIFRSDIVYTVVLGSGEQVEVKLVGSTNVDIRVSVSDARPPGSVRGLLGNMDGNRGNDLVGADGVAAQMPAGGFRSGAFVESWRVAADQSLFDGPAPVAAAGATAVPFSLSDLPADLDALKIARALADLAGLDNPILRDNAILDYLLTGSAEAFASAARVVAPIEAAVAGTASEITRTVVGVGGRAAVVEGDAGAREMVFDVFRVGSSTEAVSLRWQVSGDVDAADFVGNVLPSGTVELAHGQTVAQIVLQIAGDEEVEADEAVAVTIATDRPDVVVLIHQATNGILTDDAPPTLLGGATGDDPAGWAEAWTREGVTIEHKADLADAAEAWGAVRLEGAGPDGELADGDLWLGDLVVSGGGTTPEIAGSEALRVTLATVAQAIEVELAGLATGEIARLAFFDQDGTLVLETDVVDGGDGSAAFGIDEVSVATVVIGAVAGGFTLHGLSVTEASLVG
jgi:hypothetical protein